MSKPSLRILLAEGCESYVERKRADIDGVVVHRIEVSQEDAGFTDEPADVQRFFAEHPIGRDATGGKMPYPLLIDAEGRVTQCVPLERVTPHARAHNPMTIGVACIGDFRRDHPPSAQRRALVLVLTDLLYELGLDASHVYGHDELSGASNDPDKICPGDHLELPYLRDAVALALSKTQRTIYRFLW